MMTLLRGCACQQQDGDVSMEMVADVLETSVEQPTGDKQHVCRGGKTNVAKRVTF